MAGPANIQPIPSAMNATGIPENTHKADAYEIGILFIQQYYTFLSKSPDSLYKFYASNSQLIRGAEGENAATHVGQQSILEHLKTFEYSDCKLTISSFDAQSCSTDSILLQVMGEIANKNSSPQRFVQTFCLSETQTGFYVANDIFRLIKDSIFTSPDLHPDDLKPIKQVISSQKNIPSKASALTDAKPSTNPSEERATKELATKSEQISETGAKGYESSIASLTMAQPDRKEASTLDSTSSEPTNLSTPAKSWANLVSKNAEKWGDKVAQVPGVVVPAPTPSPGTSPQSESKSFQKDTDPFATHIAVRNPKGSYTNKAIHEIFSVHGTIKNVDYSKGTYFVEYANLESATKALAQGKFTYNVETFVVEPRRLYYNSQGSRHGNLGNGSHENRRGGNNNLSHRRNNYLSSDHPSPDRPSFDKGGPGGSTRRGGSSSGRGGNRGNRQGRDSPSLK